MGSEHALRGSLNLWSVSDIKPYNSFSSLDAGEGKQGGKEEEQKEEEEENALLSLCTLIT